MAGAFTSGYHLGSGRAERNCYRCGQRNRARHRRAARKRRCERARGGPEAGRRRPRRAPRGRTHHAPGDPRPPAREGNRAAVEAALERFGRLDAVVANAGFQHVDPVVDFPEDRWDGLISLLLTSPFLLAKYAWDALRESDHARFIAIASAHALAASPFKAGYVSAKHGVLGLVRTLALEGAEDEILATAVCPGFVRTPLVEGQIASQAKAHGMSEDRVLED